MNQVYSVQIFVITNLICLVSKPNFYYSLLGNYLIFSISIYFQIDTYGRMDTSKYIINFKVPVLQNKQKMQYKQGSLYPWCNHWS